MVSPENGNEWKRGGDLLFLHQSASVAMTLSPDEKKFFSYNSQSLLGVLCNNAVKKEKITPSSILWIGISCLQCLFTIIIITNFHHLESKKFPLKLWQCVRGFFSPWFTCLHFSSCVVVLLWKIFSCLTIPSLWDKIVLPNLDSNFNQFSSLCLVSTSARKHSKRYYY